jgi:hypothetical protein
VAFRGNRAERPHMWGGAVALLSDATAVFKRCEFDGNVAALGGAVYVRGETGGRKATATFERCASATMMYDTCCMMQCTTHAA